MSRADEKTAARLQIGDLLLDTEQRLLFRGAERIRLPKLSYALLLCLVRRAPGIVSNEELLQEVWGDVVVGEETVKRRVSVLRQALGDDSEDPTYIEANRGVGYRLIPAVIPAVDDVRSRNRPRPWYFMLIAAALLIAASVLFYPNLIPQGSDESPVTGNMPSIAVLAFENFSPDPDDAYFAEGVSEEILQILAQIDGLRVASRTSAFSFRDSGLRISEIARELGVDYVLEGSVRKQRNDVRITAQLIDARSDAHLWSESYQHELADIFAVQQEIAHSIARTLPELLGVSRIDEYELTTNLQAYELFLRGRQLFHERGPALDKAIERLRAATELDPQFAEAWTYLGATAQIEWGYDTATPLDVANTIADAASRRALELDPEQGLALAVRAEMAADRGNWIEAFDLHGQAVNVAPNDSTVRMWFGQINYLFGYLDDARSELEAAHEVDPFVGIINGALGLTHLAAGDTSIADRYFERAEELGWEHHAESKVNYQLLTGEPEAAVAYYRTFFTRTDDPEWLASWKKVAAAWRDSDAAGALVSSGDELRGPRNFTRLTLLLMLDEKDAFFADLAEIVPADPRWRYRMRPVWLQGNRGYVEDPRFLKIMEGAGVTDLWKRDGYPDGCQLARQRLDCSERWPR